MFCYTTKIKRFIIVIGNKLPCPILDRYCFQIKKEGPWKVVKVVSMQQNSSIFNGLTVWKYLWVSLIHKFLSIYIWLFGGFLTVFCKVGNLFLVLVFSGSIFWKLKNLKYCPFSKPLPFLIKAEWIKLMILFVILVRNWRVINFGIYLWCIFWEK